MKPFFCHNCLVLIRYMKYQFIIIFAFLWTINGIGQTTLKPKFVGNLSGTIQDAKNGKPVPGSTVMLYSKSDAKNNKIVTSDKNGEFLFEIFLQNNIESFLFDNRFV